MADTGAMGYEEAIDTLKAMFGDVSRGTLAMVLEAHSGAPPPCACACEAVWRAP